ncbi:hypothetical protein CGCFRS4_v007425 [Colletotrichum fructicola]|nr:hypothetical protein CGCFRS4_v007425 [Colletotrichum fructicola]
MTATPPIAPPTIAPMFVCDCSEAEDVVAAVDVEVVAVKEEELDAIDEVLVVEDLTISVGLRTRNTVLENSPLTAKSLTLYGKRPC